MNAREQAILEPLRRVAGEREQRSRDPSLGASVLAV
jgi:hypothetical protein